MTEPIEDELTKLRNKLKVPAVIGAVTDGEGLLGVSAIGTRVRGGSTPVTVDDRWHIGSCAKSLTALLYGHLVEAGQAEWGIPVAELFDDIDDVDAGWSTPTIDDILHCRAGVSANPSRQQMLASHRSEEPADDERTAATRRVLSEPPKNHGTFVYSNLGYMMVGAAIDRLAGISYEDALSEHILAPLGVTTAGFGPPPLVLGHAAKAQLGPFSLGRGKPIQVNPENKKRPGDNPTILTPAGRLHLSVSDWAKLQRVFLNAGAPLVSSATIKHLMHDPGIGKKGRSMSMGWASGEQLGATHAVQGSNTAWAATALLDKPAGRTALVVANDGRMSVLTGSAHLASRLLQLDGVG